MPPELFVFVVRRGLEAEAGVEVPLLLFVVVVGSAGVGAGGAGEVMKGSLCTEPGTSQPPKPEPISKPFVAGMESMACASMASSLSKHGSPNPIGQLRMTQVTVPPMLSWASRCCSITLVMRAEAGAEGQRTGMKESTWERGMLEIRERKAGLVEGVGWSGVGGKRCSRPTEETYATICTLWERVRYFSAIAPAATRPEGIENG
jgi:hypothetical protein